MPPPPRITASSPASSSPARASPTATAFRQPARSPTLSRSPGESPATLCHCLRLRLPSVLDPQQLPHRLPHQRRFRPPLLERPQAQRLRLVLVEPDGLLDAALRDAGLLLPELGVAVSG